ncbi:MAG TPA: MBL fold metallo-hydrolase [Longimicrobiaceae bacterium]|nr:MBL fold metallo-hydrolase [Longimicrobiaceae bacterium]
MRPHPVRRLLPVLMAALLLVPAAARAQQDLSAVQVRTQHVAGSVHMLTGAGGNVAVVAGTDGVFLVDDQFAPLTEKIRAAVARISPAPVRFVLNTHWHGDHTGGNENLGRAGALIVAHDNVRTRMSADQFMNRMTDTVKASPPGALPVVTFTSAVTFHLNGDEVHAFHVPPAHTDGDAIVHFRRADVVHMGDTYFNGLYPYIDISSGGSVDGIIAAADRVLAMTREGTRIIPGHGPLSGRAELRAYREMLVTVRDRVRALVREGKTLQQVQAAKPSAEFDARWGQGFMKPASFVRVVYESVARR